jgi:hypothetical protein
MSNQQLVQIKDRDGSTKWIKGSYHHASDPAVVTSTGDKYWYFEGVAHRDDGKPAILTDKGRSKYYIVHGKYHRDGGLPAIDIANGHQEWYVDGKRHRENGPAIVDPKTGNRYFLNDEEYFP